MSRGFAQPSGRAGNGPGAASGKTSGAVPGPGPGNAFLRRNAGFAVLAVVVLCMPVFVSDIYYLSILAFMATRFIVVIGLSPKASLP